MINSIKANDSMIMKTNVYFTKSKQFLRNSGFIISTVTL